jgi:hypothetical protein
MRIGVPPEILILMDTDRGALKDEPTFRKQTDRSVLNFIRLLEGSQLFIPEEDFWKLYDRTGSWVRPLWHTADAICRTKIISLRPVENQEVHLCARRVAVLTDCRRLAFFD